MGRMGYIRGTSGCRRLATMVAVAIVGLLVSAGGASAAGSNGVFSLTPSVDFGRAVINGDYEKSIEILNTTAVSQMIDTGSSTNTAFFTEISSGTCGNGIASGAECTLLVGYEPVIFGPASTTFTIGVCPISAGSCTNLSVPASGDGVRAESLGIAPGPLTFGTTPLDSLSVAQKVTLTNGDLETSISGLSISGSAPDDFVIVNDGCTGADLAANSSCTFDVRFAPTQGGARTATLTVNGGALGQSYPTLTLNGTGGSLPAGPAGQTGPSGPAGSTGATGSTGPAGQVELVTCKTVTTHTGHPSHAVHRQKCTAKLVSGPVKFTTTGPAVHATLSRGRARLATATAVPLRSGGWRLLIARSRPMRPGAYTLTLHTAHGPRRISISLI